MRKGNFNFGKKFEFGSWLSYYNCIKSKRERETKGPSMTIDPNSMSILSGENLGEVNLVKKSG